MDVNTLHRIAIDNADAVVFLTPEPDQELLEYISQKGIPVLSKQDIDEKGVAQFPDFYESI